MPVQNSRLQLATKIHFFLLRELGQGIDVDRLLRGSSYARDVLLVCEACRGSELAELARQFRDATAAQAPARKTAAASGSPGYAKQQLDWSRDTSGFGASGLNAEPTRTAKAEVKRSWFSRLSRR